MQDFVLPNFLSFCAASHLPGCSRLLGKDTKNILSGFIPTSMKRKSRT